MANKFITLGERAYSFHDPSLGLTFAKGEVKELTDRQLQSRRIRAALNSGHLRICTEKPEEVKKYSEDDVEKLNNKLIKQVNKGVDLSKLVTNYSLEEAKLLAEKHNIELEDSDTIESILEALVDDIRENTAQ